MSELTKEEREALRQLEASGNLHACPWSEVVRLLDALDAMEAERDEARGWSSDLRDRYWKTGELPWEG